MNRHLIRCLLAASLTLGTAGTASAIRAVPHPVTIVQPDGSKLVVRIHGDENFHYITTTDGFLVRRDKDGYFKYVEVDRERGLNRLTTCRATAQTHRTPAETRLVGTLRPVRPADAAWLRSLQAPTVRKTVEQVLPASVRNRPLSADAAQAEESDYLVVLVKYADGEFHFTNPDFERWLNEEGYAENGGTGSVKDYYRDNSMGQFVPHFTVLGPYTLDHEQTYYAANDPSTGEDVDPYSMVIEAIEKAKADHPELDFSKFDNDGDGYMDNVNIVYGGYSEASTGVATDMWPHSYRLGDKAIQVDGITVNNYSVSAELVGASGVRMDGIGTFVHEFGHILGLKDMYDTDDYNEGLGIDPGAYSLFASGSYNNDSRTPPYLMAFERHQMGWLRTDEMTRLDRAADITLPNVSTNTAAYIDAQPDLGEGEGHEWFVLENRQREGWDKYIPYHGLLIYHYDYTAEMVEKYWSVNGPNNNARHRCLYIEAADGIDDTNTRRGDTFPGTTGSTAFTDDTTPAARSWTGERLRTPITDIREEGGLIYFQVKGGVTARTVVQTQAPAWADIAADSLVLNARIVSTTQEVAEAGFCWSATAEEPQLGAEGVQAVAATPADNAFRTTLHGLTPATTYHVRAYLTLADGTTTYGAVIPVRTEHAVMQAPVSLTFLDQTDGELDYWRIVDQNNDANTWQYDETTGAMVYNADYWNNANDWLISERMHVPERGSLYILRGVTDAASVEKLDVYVSTRSRDVADFHLVRSFSLADQFGTQALDEVDLSDFAGQDVYVALVCTSERLQNALWLWQVLLTQRLETPKITKFDLEGDVLRAEWTPIEGAVRYYAEFFRLTDEPVFTQEYLPENTVDEATGDVTLGTGTFRFTGTGSVTTRPLGGDITSVMYILKSGGPRGSSTFSVEASADGRNWTRIGELQRITSTDSEGATVDLTAYLQDTHYDRLRLTCNFDGRMVDIRNFTVTYGDGVERDTLAQGVADNPYLDIREVTPGEFQQGMYELFVYAGDGLLYYDASAPSYFTAAQSGIDTPEASADAHGTLRALSRRGIVRLAGLTPGRPLSLYAADGRLLLRFVPTGTSAAVSLPGYEGVVIIR